MFQEPKQIGSDGCALTVRHDHDRVVRLIRPVAPTIDITEECGVACKDSGLWRCPARMLAQVIVHVEDDVERRAETECKACQALAECQQSHAWNDEQRNDCCQ